MAGTYEEMGRLLMLAGELQPACDYAIEAQSIRCDQGMPLWIATEIFSLVGVVYIHSGRYGRAREMLDEGLAIARSQSSRWLIGEGLVSLAKFDLADGNHLDAARRLSESIPLLEAIDLLNVLADVCLALSACEIMTDNLVKAKENLMAGLHIGIDTDLYATLCYTMALSTPLTLIEGDVEHAVERYAVAESQPFVANSAWFADVYGKEIEEAKVTLAPDVVAAAGGRGRERELRTAVEEIIGIRSE